MTNDDCRRRLETFYSVLEAKLEPYRNAKQHLDRFLSSDFNVFKWIEPDEDRLSDIIADLLDQNGAHGQQRRFLNAFLRRIGKDDLCDKQLRRVTCQHTFTFIFQDTLKRGRFDILVEFRDFVIAIENKPWPWSKEGNEQIGKYSDYLNQKYNGRFCLIFLTSEGDKPISIKDHLKEELLAENKLICISYDRDMLKWLAECCQLCESDKFRWFLRDFMDHLNGGQTMVSQKEKKIILAHALEEKNLETALDINSAFEGKLHVSIIAGFLDKLKKSVLERLGDPDMLEWKIDNKLVDSGLKQHTAFGLKKETWRDRYAVIVGSRQDNAYGFQIGVWKDKDAPRVKPEYRLMETLNDAFNTTSIERTNWWEWRQTLQKPYQDWGSKDGLIELQLREDKAVEHLGTYLVNIIEVAAPIIDEHIRGSE